jgi:hypothetical protein
VVYSFNPSLGRLRQEDNEFKASTGYIVGFILPRAMSPNHFDLVIFRNGVS